MTHLLTRKTLQKLAVLVTGLLLMIGLAAPVLDASASSAQKPAAALGAWTLQWSDEFNGSGAVSGSNWLYDTGHGYGCSSCGNWGTGEVESMSTSTANVNQTGGHLAITPIRDGSGNWTSGRIETQRTDFQPPAGGAMAIEASIQQPNVSGAAAAGYWPAFWALGAPFRGVYTNWPSIGELDILEDINGLSSVFGTLHCGTSPGGPCNETTGIGSGQHACSGCQTGYHTYRLEFDKSVSPQQLRWYLDGVNYFTVNANQVDATTWANATNHGFFVIFDVAMGGGFPAAFGGGPTGSTASSVPMNVDYVRVYYANGSGGTNWTNCAGENGTCSFSGTQQVRYGSGNFYSARTATGSIACNNATFGDPNFGVAKTCDYRSTVGNGSFDLTGWTQCAGENGTCSASGQVIFGANGWFSQRSSSGSIACNNATFGDPAYGVSKACYTQASSGSTQGVDNISSNQARPWYKCSATCSYVIVHYIVASQAQQNVNATYNSSLTRWEYTITGITSGQVLQYQFTYNDGLQHDTAWFSWTKP